MLAASWTYWWKTWVESTMEKASMTLRLKIHFVLKVLACVTWRVLACVDFLFLSLCYSLVTLLHRGWWPIWRWGATPSQAGPCSVSVSMKPSVRDCWLKQKQRKPHSPLPSPYQPSTREASPFLMASQISLRTPTLNCPNGGRHVTHRRH